MITEDLYKFSSSYRTWLRRYDKNRASFNFANMFTKTPSKLRNEFTVLRKLRMFHLILNCVAFDQVLSRSPNHCRMCLLRDGYFSYDDKNVFTKSEVAVISEAWDRKDGFYKHNICNIPDEMRPTSCLSSLGLISGIKPVSVHYVCDVVNQDSVGGDGLYFTFYDVKSVFCSYIGSMNKDRFVVSNVIFETLMSHLRNGDTQDTGESVLEVVGVYVDYKDLSESEKRIIKIVSESINVFPKWFLSMKTNKDNSKNIVLSMDEVLGWT